MISLPIKQVIQETHDTITLLFDLPANSWPYQAGQFVTIGTTIAGSRYYRSYSLAPVTSEQPCPAITIKRAPNGIVSNYLHDHIQAGSYLECSSPQGHFTLPSESHLTGHFVFIAAGSGIVPLFAMIHELLAKSSVATATLLYANRDEASIIYHKQIHALASDHPDRLAVTDILSQPQASWQGPTGRLDAPMLLSSFSKEELFASSYYLCAPEAMMVAIRKTLSVAGVASDKVHQESFLSTSPAAPPSEALDKAASLTIHQDDESYEVVVEKGETLLDADLDQGIDIPVSCSSGICNTCRARCLEGKVHMSEDVGLSDEEREEGYVLTCVGYPASEKVVISLEDEWS